MTIIAVPLEAIAEAPVWLCSDASSSLNVPALPPGSRGTVVSPKESQTCQIPR